MVLNTVESAVEVWKALRSDKALKLTDADIRLTHSRFRPSERKPWGDAFLNRAACALRTNRIIVSTQVVEAGVDISTSLLITELAPWTSLVQRFGRCTRWGGVGQIIIVDFGYKNDKQAAPYSMNELNASHDVCKGLPDVGPTYLECFEENNKASLPLADAGGEFHTLPATALDLSPSEAGLSSRTGRSWTERVPRLLNRFGPFTLAWLEAILRAADQCVSRQMLTDKLLEEDHAEHELETGYRTLAQSAGEGTQTPPPPGDSPPRRQLHGDGGRTGGRSLDSGTTRPPYSATRYVDTHLGILSYQELAPLLAERAGHTEIAIADRIFSNQPVGDVLLDLHRCIITRPVSGRKLTCGSSRAWWAVGSAAKPGDLPDSRLTLTGRNLDKGLISRHLRSPAD